MSYFSLHNHSEFSAPAAGLDSMNRYEEMIKYALEIGLTGINFSEHDCLSGAVRINKLQKKYQKTNPDFKISIGNEIYLIDSFDPEVKERRKYFHFLLLALDRTGYQALVELSSRAWIRSAVQYGRRRVPTLKSDLEEVMKWAKGHVMGFTACLGGELPNLLLNEETPEPAWNFVKWCQEIFGYDDFFIELQSSSIPDQTKFNKRATYVFSDVLTSEFVITTDSHYLKKEDFSIFEAFLRSAQENREVKEYYDAAYIQTEEEIREYLNYLPKKTIDYALENTIDIAKRIEFYDLEEKPIIPSIPIKFYPAGLDTIGWPVIDKLLTSGDLVSKYIVETSLSKLKAENKYNDLYLTRLSEELDTCIAVGEQIDDSIFNYFYSMKHFIDLAWEIGCAVGPSRGSAAGCLILYLIDVIQMDPIERNLYFWRFIDRERPELPDIDSDFDAIYRQKIIEAILEERGEVGVAQMATFRKLTLKSAINSACRGYRSKEFPEGIDNDVAAYLSSLIEVKRGFVATLAQTIEGDAERQFSKNSSFIKEIKAYPGLLELIQKIEGLVVGNGSHAAALVFGNKDNPITKHSALIRSPNGDLTTALDLHDGEYCSLVKYDFLQLTTLTKISETFRLLQKDGLVDKDLTLKECYRKYLDPNKIDYTNPLIWEKLIDDSVLEVFQFDSAVGKKIAKQLKPQTLEEMSLANGIMRLTPSPDEEHPADRFVRIKENPREFQDEMTRYNMPQHLQDILHEELDRFNGVCCTQESMMLCVMRLAGYSMKEANILRKTIAKKQLSQIETQRDFFMSKIPELNQEQKDYLWSICAKPQLSYSFAIAHGLPYSAIGIQCIYLNILFPPIYWQTACLLFQSGSLDGKSSDYNRIAKAVSTLQQQGVNILPIDINKSEKDFTLDAETNSIYFGLSAVKGLKEKVIDNIIDKRPFDNLYHFNTECHPDIASLATLAKAGGFDNFGDREHIINDIVRLRADTKEKLNGQNLAMIERLGLWPEELDFNKRIFNFNRDLKRTEYQLTERQCDFLDKLNYPHNGESIEKDEWKSTYDFHMKDIKNYLIDNQEEMLEKLNNTILTEYHNKYFAGNIAKGEIETLGINFAEHPLTGVTNVSWFSDLPKEPAIATLFQVKERTIPLYQLTTVCGFCIAVDKLHSSFTLLAADCVFDVKLRKEEFAFYAKQVSQVVNGKKKIIEKSWLRRGVPLMVQGMRKEDMFQGKKYKNSKLQHVVSLITEILDDGHVKLQLERKKGTLEEAEMNEEE